MTMTKIEIIGGIVLIVTAVLSVILCLMQDSKQQQNMTSAITGGANDSFYEQNEGRTKEAIFRKITRTLLVIFFAVTIGINLYISFYGNK